MSLETTIAQSLASACPIQAARVLEALPEDALREFLAEGEARTASGVLEVLTPMVAARALSLVPSSRAADLLSGVALDRASDLLRRLTNEERENVLSQLVREREEPLRKLLRFPEGTAGALMEPRVESFRENMTAADALRHVQRPGGEARYYLYLVDDQLILTGVTSLRDLVTAPADRTLRSLIKGPVQTLSARAGKRAILEHPAWQRYPVLPVVDDAGRLLGIFRYETFRKLQGLPESESASPLNAALALSELFWIGATSLLRGMEEPTEEERRTEGLGES